MIGDWKNIFRYELVLQFLVLVQCFQFYLFRTNGTSKWKYSLVGCEAAQCFAGISISQTMAFNYPDFFQFKRPIPWLQWNHFNERFGYDLWNIEIFIVELEKPRKSIWSSWFGYLCIPHLRFQKMNFNFCFQFHLICRWLLGFQFHVMNEEKTEQGFFNKTFLLSANGF